MKLTNDEGHSLSIAVWLATDDYDHNTLPGKHISATGLLKPTRMIILSNRVQAAQSNTDYDIALNIPSSLGSAVHSGIEHAWYTNYKQALTDLGYPKQVINRIMINPTPAELKADPKILPVYMEQRASRDIMGYTVSGKFDFIGEGCLEDFKTSAVYGFMKGGNGELYILQGSIYRWLNPEIVTKDYMRIQHIFTDWSKLRSKIEAKRGYPQSRLVTKKYNLLSLQETENFITNKLSELIKHENTAEIDLPGCTREDLWQDEPVYKYYKNPAKMNRSTANFDMYADAHARMLKDGSVGLIKEVLGKVRRCGYCNAFDLCTQKDMYAANKTLVLP